MAMEEDLKRTKKVYNSALTKLVLKVKKLEKQVKSGKARRRARIVLSEDEDAAEDPSKQGRKIAQIDTDPTISLLIENLRSGEKGEKEISTANVPVSTAGVAVTTASASISTASPPKVSTAEVSTASPEVGIVAAALVYIRMNASKAKDKGKSDPVVLRYHALQNRPYSIAKVRKNMVMYLKNQVGYKQSYFKGMKYEEIRPIFEKVWDQTHTFVPMSSESGGTRKKTLARKRACEKKSEKNSKRQKNEEAGDLRMIFDPDEKDDIWMNQLDWKLLKWILQENCGVHTLFMDGTPMQINMLVEKKYPLIKDLLEKMLNLQLEAEEESTMSFELLKLIKSQIEEQ
ncbi:hypothetical protein Tco_0696724 [Tanacetum coccineum]